MVKSKLLGGLTLLLVTTLTNPIYAQSSNESSKESLKMNLEECLDYAKDSSITLQQARLNIENSVANQLSAKGAFLPTVSGSVGQSFSSYPALSSGTKSSYSGSYGLDLSMTLYKGGSNRASLQQSDLDYKISNLELEEFENSLEVSITEVYVEILYAIEKITVAENSLEVSLQNEARGRAFLEVGSINQVDYAQLESARSSYEYDLIVSKTQLSNLYVVLRHLLEVSYGVEIEIEAPELANETLLSQIPSVSDVYNTALDTRPEIAATKLSVESSVLDVKIAKSGYLPTLSLSAGTGVNHNSSSSYTMSAQMRNSFDTSAGLSLSVPIFSKFSNRSAVAKATNNVKIAELSLAQVEKDLYQVIETLHNNATTSQAKFLVSEFQLTAAFKSMDLTRQQFELGMKNTIELLTEQDNYNQSCQDYLTNKYTLILNKALLNYYKTDIIKL